MNTEQVQKRRVGRPRIDEPDPIDVHVGKRVRQRRTLLGMSQEKLGEAINLTFQQVQKYERGANRIGASRLFELARVLEVQVSYFFDDAPAQPAGGLAEPPPPPLDFAPDPMTKRETLELVRAYYRISDPNIRRRLFELVRAVADGQAEGGEGDGTGPSA